MLKRINAKNGIESDASITALHETRSIVGIDLCAMTAGDVPKNK